MTAWFFRKGVGSATWAVTPSSWCLKEKNTTVRSTSLSKIPRLLVVPVQICIIYRRIMHLENNLAFGMSGQIMLTVWLMREDIAYNWAASSHSWTLDNMRIGKTSWVLSMHVYFLLLLTLDVPILALSGFYQCNFA